MNNSTYGIVRSSLITANNDVDIFYNYKPTRNSTDETYAKWKKVESPSTWMENAEKEVIDDGSSDKRLPGMYNLKLPTSVFNKKGFYTVYIRPREFVCTIMDIGVLAAYPDKRGIVINKTSVPSEYQGLFENDNLTGYRIEYFNNNMRQDYYRIVTSCNLCSPITQNLSSTNSNTNGYRFDATGTLAFITVSPSTAPGFKPNAKPYIGVPSQMITICNTKFDPVFMEIEMTEHDIETLSIMAEGDQLRNHETGTLTTFNFDGEIYKQQQFSTVKDTYTNTNIAEIKYDRSDNIDNTMGINDVRNL